MTHWAADGFLSLSKRGAVQVLAINAIRALPIFENDVSFVTFHRACLPCVAIHALNLNNAKPIPLLLHEAHKPPTNHLRNNKTIQAFHQRRQSITSH